MTYVFGTLLPHIEGLLITLLAAATVFIGAHFRLLRGSIWRQESNKLLSVFPSWFLIKCTNGSALFLGALISLMTISLVPLGVICFHFPVLGVSTSLAVWLAIFLAAGKLRTCQLKKEYFKDSAFSFYWVMVSLLIETLSRLARAITLGARISINVMMGAILHSVAGDLAMAGGVFSMVMINALEILVVLVQTYVLFLLVSLYLEELE